MAKFFILTSKTVIENLCDDTFREEVTICVVALRSSVVTCTTLLGFM